MNRVNAEHRRRNEMSRDSWEFYAAHRQKVTSLLCHCGGEQRRLCVLGAGNCNDLDLSALVRTFDEIHLIDLDDQALAAGTARQQMAENEKIHLCGGVDITSVMDELSQWSTESLPDSLELDQLLHRAVAAPPPNVQGQFDVVASVCLLTQLIDSIAMTLGEQHWRFLDVMTTIRARHQRLLIELLRPAGMALLITDVVSSLTYPRLGEVSETELPNTLTRLVNERNFFTGANPFVLQAFFQTDPAVSPLVDEVRLERPWLWNFGPRVYAVCAIVVRKK